MSYYKSRIHPKLSHWKQKIRFQLPEFSIALKEISQAIQVRSFVSEIERIVYLRNWINTHSVHLIDEEHDSYAFDVPKVVKYLNMQRKGERDLPHLSCGPRSYAMKEILDQLGIESRIVDIFGLSDAGSLNPHTLIEVYDSETRSWTLQDPDFNVMYVNKTSNNKISAAEALMLGKHGVGADSSGYNKENELNLNNTLKGLFELLILYRFSYQGTKSDVLIKDDAKPLLSKIVHSEFGELKLMNYLVLRDPSLLRHPVFLQSGAY